MTHVKISTLIIFSMILSSLFTYGCFSESNIPWWNDSWSFNQEIILPIDTSKENSIFQPIDINVNFENKCWAKNEYEHSIRVCCWDKNNWKELESQIYNLEYSENEIIESCGLVFLVPENANGEERY